MEQNELSTKQNKLSTRQHARPKKLTQLLPHCQSETYRIDSTPRQSKAVTFVNSCICFLFVFVFAFAIVVVFVFVFVLTVHLVNQKLTGHIFQTLRQFGKILLSSPS